MRFTRKRFTQSSTRDTSDRDHAILTYKGISRFSQSQLGMSVKREKLMEQYQRQGSKCAKCPDQLDLADAVFLTTHFDAGGLIPLVVHKRCRRKYEREQARIKAQAQTNAENTVDTV